MDQDTHGSRCRGTLLEKKGEGEKIFGAEYQEFGVSVAEHSRRGMDVGDGSGRVKKEPGAWIEGRGGTRERLGVGGEKPLFPFIL